MSIQAQIRAAAGEKHRQKQTIHRPFPMSAAEQGVEGSPSEQGSGGQVPLRAGEWRSGPLKAGEWRSGPLRAGECSSCRSDPPQNEKPFRKIQAVSAQRRPESGRVRGEWWGF